MTASVTNPDDKLVKRKRYCRRYRSRFASDSPEIKKSWFQICERLSNLIADEFVCVPRSSETAPSCTASRFKPDRHTITSVLR